MAILSKKQAIEFLGIDDKLFDNFFQIAGEFQTAPRKNRYSRIMFDENELRSWLEGYKFRTIELNMTDYLRCLDFALAMHFRGYVQSDFGTGRQREFGQKITNWVKGQLGEIAVQKFFKREFDLDITLDFNVHEEIVPQDIIGVLKNGEMKNPKIGVGVKSSKPKNSYLILGENEIKLSERRSDIYIYCRPDLPDDHLLRITSDKIEKLVSDQIHFPSYKSKIPLFYPIPCEIAGWCRWDELSEVGEIPRQKFDGIRFVIQSGKLRRSKQDWQKLADSL